MDRDAPPHVDARQRLLGGWHDIRDDVSSGRAAAARPHLPAVKSRTQDLAVACRRFDDALRRIR